MYPTELEALAVPISQACRALGIGRSKCYQLINENQLAVIKLGRRTLVPVAALRAFVETKMKEAA